MSKKGRPVCKHMIDIGQKHDRTKARTKTKMTPKGKGFGHLTR